MPAMIVECLMSLEMFERLPPKTQGFAHYFQAHRPGSPLPQECPYELGTDEHEQWLIGETEAEITVLSMVA